MLKVLVVDIFSRSSILVVVVSSVSCYNLYMIIS
jgi:hypothetical protein